MLAESQVSSSSEREIVSFVVNMGGEREKAEECKLGPFSMDESKVRER